MGDEYERNKSVMLKLVMVDVYRMSSGTIQGVVFKAMFNNQSHKHNWLDLIEIHGTLP